MRNLVLITLALCILSFSQCKKENISDNSSVNAKKLMLRCECPMGKAAVDLIADTPFLYNFKNNIISNNLYYKCITDVELRTMIWNDGYKFVNLGLPSASAFLSYGNYYQWRSNIVYGIYRKGTADVYDNAQYDEATATWSEKIKQFTQANMHSCLIIVNFIMKLHDIFN